MELKSERAVVTGVAGFVGSNLAERLLSLGVEVLGLDILTPYYDPSIKRANLGHLERYTNFRFAQIDLATDGLEPYLAGVDVVFHQAAQAGVRSSWADGFELSVRNNVIATQRLLEAVRVSEVETLVYASSSSVYGDAAKGRMREDAELRPYSPYGVTKLSGEQLCSVYGQNWGIRVAMLRYFTVYGPRQRPDMATHRLIQCALTGASFPLFASADHVRDFTYVSDIVEANLAAAAVGGSETAINVAGGAVTSMKELITVVEEVTGRPVSLDQLSRQAGDVTRTEADLARATEMLGWRAAVGLREGIEAQVEWHRANRTLLEGARG